MIIERNEEMKKYIIILLLGILLFGCSKKEETQMNKIDIKEKMPVKVFYRRLWMYGAEYESEDKEIIKDLKDAISDAVILNEVNYSVTDFTDIVVFYYEDGSESVYEFEEYNIVIDDKRYALEGIKQIREVLDRLVK